MKKRTLLATATLTALVLSFGTLQPAPAAGAAALAAHAQPLDALAAPLDALAQPLDALAAEAPAAPQWGYFWGWESEEALLWGIVAAVFCSPFAGPGAIACGITGAL